MRGVRGSPFVGDFNIIYLGPEEFFLILIQITFLAIPLCHLEVIVFFGNDSDVSYETNLYCSLYASCCLPKLCTNTSQLIKSADGWTKCHQITPVDLIAGRSNSQLAHHVSRGGFNLTICE